MKTLKFSALFAVALTVVSGGVLRAEYTASEIVSLFNANGGWSFISTGSVTERLFTTRSGATPDLRAYSASLGNTAGIYSTCVSGGSTAPGNGTATLYYSATTGLTQNISGQFLSVGGAVLYQRYAAGTLSSFNYGAAMNTGTRTNDSSTLRSAIMVLNSMSSTQALAYDWNSNKYLQYLLSIRDDKSYWALDYNTNLRYTELGDFAVFMMHTGTTTQSQLYVSYASHTGNFENNGVPEPATLLLWTLGSAGALGVGHYRRQSRKA